MTLLNCSLEVVRVEIATTDNDQVLDAAGDEQFVRLEKTEISAAKVRTGAAIGKICLKHVRGFFGPIPVTGGHAWSTDPNLTHFTRRARCERFRVRDNDLQFALRSTAADERNQIVFTRLVIGDCESSFERSALHRLDGWLRLHACAGNEERRFRQAIAGIKSLALEATRSEEVHEALQSFRAHRLSTIESDSPTTQIEQITLFCRDFLGTQIISEVWSTTGRSAIT